MAAAQAAKSKKKKWSKGKVRDTANHMTLLDRDTFKRLGAEVPKMKMITLSTMSERLKINCSLAKRCIRHLEDQGLIREVYRNGAQIIYTRASNAEDEDDE